MARSLLIHLVLCVLKVMNPQRWRISWIIFLNGPDPGVLAALHTRVGNEASEQAPVKAEAFLNSLTYQKGIVQLSDDLAVLNVPDSFRYIGPEDSKRFLEEGWGNPGGSGQIGMLLPMDTDLFGDTSWAVVISYQEDGHISDKDAGKIDYSKLLADMRESTLKSNKKRSEKGYPPIELIGWAAQPHYDSQTNG